EAGLATTGVGGEQVDDLDAGLEELHLHVLLGEGRGRAVDGQRGGGLHRTALVHRVTGDVQDAAEGRGPHRNGDGRAGVGHGLAAGEALGAVHGDAPDSVLAEVLGDLDGEVVLLGGDGRVGDLQ